MIESAALSITNVARTRSSALGPAARPVSIPEDMDTGEPRASGVVYLPFHIRWSEPLVAYDLGREADRLRVYEQVLREGTVEDVRRFIDLDELLAHFGDLVLPSNVRLAWTDWFRRHRGIELEC